VTPQQTGFLGIAILLGLLALGCPVGLAMILVGGAGFAAIVGLEPALTILQKSAFGVASNHSFTLIPLFLLMGALVARAGLSRDLFLAARRFTGGWHGGLAVAGVTASAAFSAVSGSSLATASTMTRVAWPEMRAQGYDPRLAAGSLAAGGTLGIMIPPSIALLLYALITEQSVGAMFLAGLLPGLLAYALYVACVAVMARIWQPDETQSPAPGSLGLALRRFAPVALLFGLVMGGLYGGLFTPTEAGGAGAALALVFALWRGTALAEITAAMRETVAITANLFVILIGAEVFGYLLSVSQISSAMADFIRAAGWGPTVLVIAIVGFYLVLGCLMESLAMILLTVPVFFPLIRDAGIDPVWFGVICVVAVETGLISPPVGMNLFVVQSAAPGLALGRIMLGVVPFVLTDILRLAILIAFPVISLWLPDFLGP